MTTVQRAVVERLRAHPDAYISQFGDFRYEISGAPRRVMGVAINMRVDPRTFAGLLKHGLIAKGRRVRYCRQQVGYFLSEQVEPTTEDT